MENPAHPLRGTDEFLQPILQPIHQPILKPNVKPILYRICKTFFRGWVTE